MGDHRLKPGPLSNGLCSSCRETPFHPGPHVSKGSGDKMRKFREELFGGGFPSSIRLGDKAMWGEHVWA